MKQELVAVQQLPISEIMSLSKAFAESGMFPDVSKSAQAMVKIVAGQEIGIPPFQAMNGIHIIKGKTTLGAGIIASRIKGSGKYDYDVKQLDAKGCVLIFKQGDKVLGESEFTLEDARKAGTQNIDKYPKNMLFARAISNGVKWYCPDVFAGPVYVPEEMEVQTEEAEYTEVHDVPGSKLKPMKVGGNAYKSAVKYLQEGKSMDEVREIAYGIGISISDEVAESLIQAIEEAA